MLANNPYVIGGLVVLLTAALLWVYTRTVTKENAPEQAKKSFGRTALVGAIAAAAVGYWVSSKSRETLLTTPFEVVPTRPAAAAV